MEEPVRKIHIIEIESGNDPHAIRYAAECWGAFVTATWVGNSGQVVEYLSSEPEAELIIICGHGDGRGLLLPELAEQVRDRYPYNDVIRPKDFDQFLKLNGNVVINSSCMGGMSSLAKVFLKHGASHYIGPNDYPHGDAALMYLLGFLYNHIARKQSVAQAHRLASRANDDRKMYRLYRAASKRTHPPS